jgi:PAS domain S-box-containing protein
VIDVGKTSKILLVDDEPIILDVAMEFLSLNPEYDIDIASSAIEGLRKLRDGSYDAIVSDYQMPQMDGLEFLKTVRCRNSLIPFILFTGRGREEVAIEAINSGADFYVKKGGDPRSQYAELTNTIKQAIARSHAEQAHADAKERYRSLYDHTLGLVYTHDLQGIILDANPASLKIAGYTLDEVVGMNIMDLIAPEYVEKASASVQEIIQTGTQKRYGEFRLRCKDGNYIDIETAGSIIYRDGKPCAILGIGRDITERKRASKALKVSEERFLQVTESAGEWIWEVSTKGVYTYCSPVVEKIMGYRPDELVWNMHFYDLLVPEIREDVMREVFAAFHEKLPIRGMINAAIRKDGRTVILEMNGFPVIDRSGTLTGFRGANIDITAREVMMVNLRSSEVRYRELYESMMDAYARVNMEGHIIESNGSYQSMTGYSQTELSGMTYSDITPEIWHEREEKIIKEQLNVRGYTDVYRKEYQRKDGTVFPVELRSFLVRDENGCQAGRWAIVRDITERERAENKLQQEHDRAQMAMDTLAKVNKKLDLLSRLTFHDLQNQLLTLNGHIQRARGELDRPISMEKLLKMQRTTERIQQFLQFAHDNLDLEKALPSWHRLDECFGELVSSLDPDQIRLDLDVDGWEIFSDALLDRAFFNLGDNSIRHGEKVTNIRISSTEKNGSLIVQYQDNGAGVPVDLKEKIFQPKHEKKGTHGMMIVKEILAITGMTIEEKGVHGQGALFEINIPSGAFRRYSR